MKLKKKIHIKRPVINISATPSESLLVLDDMGNIREIGMNSYNALKGLKTSVPQNEILSNRVVFSKHGNLAIMSVPKRPMVVVFDLDNKKILHKVGQGYHQDEIISVAVDNQNNYFLTGGQDGRVILWSIQTGGQVFSLPRHRDNITAVSFSPDSQWVAVGDFTGDIHLTNISLMKSGSKPLSNSVSVTQLLFLSERHLISLDKSNTITLWNFRTSEKLKDLIKLQSDVTRIDTSLDGNFLFIGTNHGIVTLYNLVTHEVISRNFIQVEDTVTSFVSVASFGDLVISDAKGFIYFYNIYSDQKKLGRFIKNEKYKEAYALIETNEILRYTDEFKFLEEVWQKTIRKTEILLEKGHENITYIEVMLEPFEGVPEKHKKAQEIIEHFQAFGEFKKHISNKNFHLAYGMIGKYPEFKRTELYKKLEHFWDAQFKKAKAVVFKDGGEEKAKELLKYFRGISEKTFLLKQLMEQRSVFINFQKLFFNKQFKNIFEYVEKYEFLESTGEYQKLLAKGDEQYIEMQKNIKNKQFLKAEKTLDFLQMFPDYREEVKEIRVNIKLLSKFYQAWKNQRYSEAYELIEKHEIIQDLPEVVEFESKWMEVVHDAEIASSKGDIDQVKDLLKEYLTIEPKYLKIGTIFKIAYLRDIEKTMQDNYDNFALVNSIIAKAIHNYIALFGEDQAIEDFIHRMRKEKGATINTKDLFVGAMKEWTPDKIVDSILDISSVHQN
jgi:hypothetical protein